MVDQSKYVSLDSIPASVPIPAEYQGRPKADALQVPMQYAGVNDGWVQSQLINYRWSKTVATGAQGRLYTLQSTQGMVFVSGNPADQLYYASNDPFYPRQPRFDWFTDPDDEGVQYGFRRYADQAPIGGGGTPGGTPGGTTPTGGASGASDVKNLSGGMAVVARDVDADMTPTSLYFKVLEGYFEFSGRLLQSLGAFDQLAAAGTSTHVWIDTLGHVTAGPTLPSEVFFFPLARITCDAAKITDIVDYRNFQTSIGGPILLARKVVNSDYTVESGYSYVRVDATNGPVAITLPPPEMFVRQLLIIRKIDASANAVTIGSTQLIDGQPTHVLNAPGFVGLTVPPDDPAYEVVL